ncbi:MAG: RNA polymerase sigma factor, partial [Acidobacteriota bacterium]
LAEDLVQETCLKACRAWSSLRSRSSCRAWIFTILYNTVCNHRRTERGALFSDVPLEELALDDARPGAAVCSASAGALHPEAGQDLRRALEALPVQFRETVCLVDVEGFTLAEASRILNVPPGTVASRLFRAHQALRRHLSGDSDGRSAGGRQGCREERP